MTKKEIEYIKTWFVVAEHDMIAAKSMIKLKPAIYDIACFHCQQTVEKYLKGFLTFHNVHFEKTHDVITLLVQCSDIDIEFQGLDVSGLNTYAVRTRYPDDYIMPPLKEAKECLKIATEIRKLVRKKVKFPK
jgi:HEPN domain-containing protein